jgi:hypothetical protein
MGLPPSGERRGGETGAVVAAEPSDVEGGGRGAGVWFSFDGSMGGETTFPRRAADGAESEGAKELEEELGTGMGSECVSAAPMACDIREQVLKWRERAYSCPILVR